MTGSHTYPCSWVEVHLSACPTESTLFVFEHDQHIQHVSAHHPLAFHCHILPLVPSEVKTLTTSVSQKISPHQIKLCKLEGQVQVFQTPEPVFQHGMSIITIVITVYIYIVTFLYCCIISLQYIYGAMFYSCVSAIRFVFLWISVTGTVHWRVWVRKSWGASKGLQPLWFPYWLRERSSLCLGHRNLELHSCAPGLQHLSFWTFSRSYCASHHNRVIRLMSHLMFRGSISHPVYLSANGKSNNYHI